MSIGRIKPGQRLTSAISARAWNRAQDAADIVLAGRQAFADGDPSGPARAPNVVLMVNDSAYPVPVGGCLKVAGLQISPGEGSLEAGNPSAEDSRAREFVRRPLLRGVRVTSLTDQIVIALEPVAAGAIGRFAANGVFPCKVRVLKSSHQYATGRPNDVTQLVSAACGPVRLLYLGGSEVGGNDPETTPYWSLGQM